MKRILIFLAMLITPICSFSADYEVLRGKDGIVSGVKRLADGANIPADVENRDYRKFLEFNAAQQQPLDLSPHAAEPDNVAPAVVSLSGDHKFKNLSGSGMNFGKTNAESIGIFYVIRTSTGTKISGSTALAKGDFTNLIGNTFQISLSQSGDLIARRVGGGVLYSGNLSVIEE